ncbi:hypothetical protein DFQ28_007594 [Apophysomyces sp. BC1034]|nr:hypothetical protein DFQ28_007594 [Apophysomyces sp. BC1034]
MLSLSTDGVREHWQEVAPELADLLATIERTEDWTLDNNPDIAERLTQFGLRLSDPSATLRLAEADKNELLFFLAYINSSKALRLVQWMDQAQEGLGSKLLNLLLAQDGAGVFANVADPMLAGTMIQRLRIVQNMPYFQQILSSSLLDSVVRAIANYPTIAHSTPVWALDVQSVQAYCDDVKRAAQDAQARHIQTYQPRTDPGKTFDDATSSCLDFLTNFQVSIPSLWDGILTAMAKQLLQRACQAARSQFDKAVNDATQSVNGVVGQVPGAGISIGTQGNAGNGPGVTGSINTDGGSTMRNTATTAVDRVINFKRFLLALILVGVFGLQVSPPAYACCGDGAVAAAGAMTAGSTVSAAVAAATSTLAAWLERLNLTIENGFGKLYVEIGKQTAGQRVFEQGVIAAQGQMYMEKARADAAVKYELSPRVCFETAGGSAGGLAAGETKANLNDLNRNFSQRTLFTPNTAAAVAKIYDDHTSKYCSQQDAQLGRCSAPVDAKLQNADVRADAMLNTSSYNQAQVDAAQALVNNLANPIPTQNIPKNWEKSSQGKAFVAGQYIEQARASVAANSLNSAIAIRTPVQGLGSAAMLDKADVSELELMESQVRGRFESPAWYKLLAGFSLENLMREQNKIQALKLWMDLKAFQQQERIETVLATQLAMDVKRVAAVLFVIVPSYKAWAWTCCDPWGWVGYAAFVQAGTAVVSAITAATGSIVGVGQLLYVSLDSGFAKLYAELGKQSAMQRTFKQGSVAVESQLYMQERVGEAAERAVVPAQQAVTVTSAALLSEQSSIARQKITKSDLDFSNEFYSIKPVDPAVVVDRHKPYCSGVDQERGRCDVLASPTMQNADINVNTITNPGEGQYETLSDEERDAALAFVRNVVNPIPETRLTAQQNTSAQAKTVDAALLADQAALSTSTMTKQNVVLRAALAVLATLSAHCGLIGGVRLIAAVSSPAFAAESKVQVDIPALIRQASTKYQGAFKMPEKQAVSQMDGMLVKQYAAASRIANERNAYLKSLYYQASTLLMNGYPIAGGTVVAIARVQPGFSQSAAGRGMASFVDAMLAGDEEEDADLVAYMERTKKAQSVLRDLRPELQLVAQLRVVGEIYHDDIAVDAGNAGLVALGASPAERKVIDKAIKAK